ncbi:MAG: DUF6168 family protein [Tenacibaculum sp.]
MIKRILIFTAVVTLTFLSAYFLHRHLLKTKQISLSFSLLSMYLFNTIASLSLYIIVEFTAKIKTYLGGYIYLASVFLKFFCFALMFKSLIFGNNQLAKAEQFSILIPLFLSLVLEAVFISRSLNKELV